MRDAVVRFYFQLVRDYRMYRFLPHTAVYIWETCLGDKTSRDVIGACFLVAQVLIDTVALSIEDMARACSTSVPSLRNEEERISLRVLQDMSFTESHPEHNLRNLPNEEHEPQVWEMILQCFDHSLYLENISHRSRTFVSRYAALEILGKDVVVPASDLRHTAELLNAIGHTSVASRLLNRYASRRSPTTTSLQTDSTLHEDAYEGANRTDHDVDPIPK